MGTQGLVIQFLASLYFACQGVKCDSPPNFPPSIQIERSDFINWAENVQVPNLWLATPKNRDEIVSLSNWARINSYKLRPSGTKFSWSPITVTSSQSNSNTILVNMVTYFGGITMTKKDANVGWVKVQSGATLESLMSYLEIEDYTLISIPALGQMSVGGLLSNGCHGNGVPPLSSINSFQGFSFGSVSNTIVELEAVVYNSSTNLFEVKIFDRSDPQIAPLLVSLGRILITEATLMVGRNVNMRAISHTDIPMDTLFAPPSIADAKSLGSLSNSFGTVGLLYFPFTKEPWVNIYTITSEKPSESREVTEPYNYKFYENFPPLIVSLIGKVQAGNNALTPTLSTLISTYIKTSIELYKCGDMWGKSKNILLSTKSSTFKVLVSGYAIHTKKSNLQQVLNDFYYKIYKKNIDEFASQGKYPINGPLEVRITTVDKPQDVIIPGSANTVAQTPSFSASTPSTNDNQLDFDTVVWTDIVTFSKREFVSEFMNIFECDLFSRFSYDSRYAFARNEYSKLSSWIDDKLGNSISNYNGAWLNQTKIENIPTTYSKWNYGVSVINDLDPYQVFENKLLQDIVN